MRAFMFKERGVFPVLRTIRNFASEKNQNDYRYYNSNILNISLTYSCVCDKFDSDME